MKSLSIALFTLFIFGCDSSISPSTPDTEQSILDENIQNWENQNLASYQYTYKTSCFCPPEEDIVITVTNGSISEAFYTPGGV